MMTNHRQGRSRMHSWHPSCRINTHFRKFFLLSLPFLLAFWHVDANAPCPELPARLTDCKFSWRLHGDKNSFHQSSVMPTSHRCSKWQSWVAFFLNLIELNTTAPAVLIWIDIDAVTFWSQKVSFYHVWGTHSASLGWLLWTSSHHIEMVRGMAEIKQLNQTFNLDEMNLITTSARSQPPTITHIYKSNK